MLRRVLCLLLLLAMPLSAEPPRPRARDLGIHIGDQPPGPNNAITDVPGVRVGHATVWFGEGKLQPGKGPARTGVTAILPCPDPWMLRLPAAAFTLNGNGELTGLAYLQDIGTLESPILLTNTLNVGKVADAAISWFIRQHPEVGITDDVPIAVVAECDDSTLNDAQGRHVGLEQVLQALDTAAGGPVEEGAVGGGTGMIAYGFKGGIGTSSRVTPDGYRVGVLVQANHGRRAELVVDGVPVGREIPEGEIARNTWGSIIIVVATDAPLSQSQLDRLARRACLGLARTGAIAHHGSGDLVLAFSTANGIPRGSEDKPQSFVHLADQRMDPLYQGAVEATEEAILNALCRARTVTGRDGETAEALPLERLQDVLRKYAR